MPSARELRLDGELRPAFGNVLPLSLAGVDEGPTFITATVRLDQWGPGISNVEVRLYSAHLGVLDLAKATMAVAGPVIAAPVSSFASPTQSVGPYPPSAHDFAALTVQALLDVTAQEVISVGVGFGQEATPAIPPDWIGGRTDPPAAPPQLTITQAVLRCIPVAGIVAGVVEAATFPAADASVTQAAAPAAAPGAPAAAPEAPAAAAAQDQAAIPAGPALGVLSGLAPPMLDAAIARAALGGLKPGKPNVDPKA